MKRQVLVLVTYAILVTQLVTVSADPDNILKSSWLRTPVSVDGDITTSNEWSDANKIELSIGTNYGRSPPFQEVTLWAKNDATDLYLLYCIKFDYHSYDLQDTAYIYYLIPDPLSGYIFSDKSVTGQLGLTQDLHNLTATGWVNDLTKGGSDNIVGMGHFDGMFYWFELKKPLNSGDGLDWIFLLGETYGYADSPISKDEHLCIGLYDHSEGYDLQDFIQLSISNSDPNQVTAVGGTIINMPLQEILFSLVTRLVVYIGVIGVAMWVYLKRR